MSLRVPALRADVSTPAACLGEVYKVNAWVGPAGTVSTLHFDPHQNVLCQVTTLHFDSHDNVLCQVVGDKYVRLYPPSCSARLLPGQGPLSNTSTLSLERCLRPDEAPVPADLPFREVVVRQGQGLVIPAKHWHYVRSLSPSFSVNFWMGARAVGGDGKDTDSVWVQISALDAITQAMRLRERADPDLATSDPKSKMIHYQVCNLDDIPENERFASLPLHLNQLFQFFDKKGKAAPEKFFSALGEGNQRPVSSF
ncbi:hypothetical protein T484DRAFT_1803410 [Baffinella frigidus]|nr:hypothetical protein T484DRAFT_1803410 [Cryptophyta sp. CCMP2293]